MHIASHTIPSTTYQLQRFYITGTSNGQIECTELVSPKMGAEYIIHPYNIHIKLTEKLEPKKPDFIVVV